MYIGKPLTNVEPFQKYPAINTRALAPIECDQATGPSLRVESSMRWASAIIPHDPEINSDAK
jgi:hypothetical protein